MVKKNLVWLNLPSCAHIFISQINQIDSFAYWYFQTEEYVSRQYAYGFCSSILRPQCVSKISTKTFPSAWISVDPLLHIGKQHSSLSWFSLLLDFDMLMPFSSLYSIGYPVVTLGFGCKSYISYKVRQVSDKIQEGIESNFRDWIFLWCCRDTLALSLKLVLFSI